MGNTLLFQIGPLQATAYSLTLTVGAALAVLLTCLLARRAGRSVSQALAMSACAILGAVISARLVYLLCQLSLSVYNYFAYDGGSLAGLFTEYPELMQYEDISFVPWGGGESMIGALLGGLLAVRVWSAVTRTDFHVSANLAAPGAALALAVGRLGEAFTGQGIGKYLEDILGAGFWGEWQIHVFCWEALAAFIACAIAYRSLRRKPQGRAMEWLLIIVCMSQVLLDSLRVDDYIRFGFVHFNQLAAAVIGLVVLIRSAVRAEKAHTGRKHLGMLRAAGYLLGVGVVVAIEFALDKTTVSKLLLWTLMALDLVFMGRCCARE